MHLYQYSICRRDVGSIYLKRMLSSQNTIRFLNQARRLPLLDFAGHSNCYLFLSKLCYIVRFGTDLQCLTKPLGTPGQKYQHSTIFYSRISLIRTLQLSRLLLSGLLASKGGFCTESIGTSRTHASRADMSMACRNAPAGIYSAE